MASAERAYTTDYSYVSPSSYAEDYARKVYERNASPRYKEYERKQQEQDALREVTQIERDKKAQLSQAALVRTIILLMIIGALLIGIVWMSARATEIQYSINQIKAKSSLVEDEIAMLGIKIESSNGIESVEDYATSNLKMRYPRNNQCIYLSDKQDVKINLVEEIKSRAYKQS